MNRHSLLAGILILVAILFTCPTDAAGPMDKVIEFYTSSIPHPPKVDIDIDQVTALVETGDIIIENNRGFPQWYAAIGTLIPGTRYVHSGMVIKGHALLSYLEQLDASARTKSAHNAYVRCLQTVKNPKGEAVKIWQWVKAPILSDAKYVITPEVTRGAKMSRVVALHLKHYLKDPAVGYSVKHIRVIRPPVTDQKALNKMAAYLAYHVLKETGYDMGFEAAEQEPAICRTIEGDLTFDLTVAPVPLYCTELVWRALREAGVAVEAAKLGGNLGDALRKIPRLPRSLADKLRAPFITADLFINCGSQVYANADSPSVGEVIKAMIDESYRSVCQTLAGKIQKILSQFKPR